MKNKKGFTLVELVIVIAVIAILAGVLIGTFATVLESANKSSALQEAKASWDEYIVTIDFANQEKAKLATSDYIIVIKDKYFFTVKGGTFNPNVFENVHDAIAELSNTVTSEELQPTKPEASDTEDTYYYVLLDGFYVYTVIPQVTT